MKKVLFLFIVICSYQTALSQSDFRQAYVITNQGDTVKGFVDYREGIKNYKVCDFKKTQNQDIISYSPYQIKGYRFLNDSYFESKEILVADGIYERIFMEVLVKGRVTLYKSPDDFYVQKNDTALHRLADEKIEMLVNDRTVVKENKEYIGVLSFLLYDCPELRSTFSDKKFSITERKLTKLIENYNSCMGATSISFKEEKPWLTSSFGFVAGVNSSSIDLSLISTSLRTTIITRQDYLTREKLSRTGYNRSNSLMTGIHFEVTSPRVNEKFSVYTEVFFTSSEYLSFKKTTTSPYTYRDEVTIDLQQLKMPLGLRYTFPRKNFIPYVIGGVAGTIYVKTFTLMIRETEVHDVTSTEEFENLDIYFNRFGYWGGIGIKNKRVRGPVFFGEIRYEETVELSPPSGILKSDFQNIQILVGLML